MTKKEMLDQIPEVKKYFPGVEITYVPATSRVIEMVKVKLGDWEDDHFFHNLPDLLAVVIFAYGLYRYKDGVAKGHINGANAMAKDFRDLLNFDEAVKEEVEYLNNQS